MNNTPGLPERVSNLEAAMYEVCKNHIPHLQASVKEIKWWIRGMGVAVAVAVLKQLLGV